MYNREFGWQIILTYVFLGIISSNWNNSDLLWDSKAEKHPESTSFVWYTEEPP